MEGGKCCLISRFVLILYLPYMKRHAYTCGIYKVWRFTFTLVEMALV